MSNKKWWFKLQTDFFNDKLLRALYKRFGAEGQIIYIKMLLKSLADDYRLTYCGYENTFPEEIATDIDADPELTTQVVSFLLKHGDIEEELNGSVYYLRIAEELSGSDVIGGSAERTRRYRERKREAAQDVTRNDAEMLQSVTSDVTKCHSNVTALCSHSIAKEENNIKELETEPKPKTESTPTLEEIKRECESCGYKVKPEKFFEYNNKRGWLAVSDWRALLKSWNDNEKTTTPKKNRFNSFDQREYNEDDLELQLLNLPKGYGTG